MCVSKMNLNHILWPAAMLCSPQVHHINVHCDVQNARNAKNFTSWYTNYLKNARSSVTKSAFIVEEVISEYPWILKTECLQGYHCHAL